MRHLRLVPFADRRLAAGGSRRLGPRRFVCGLGLVLLLGWPMAAAAQFQQGDVPGGEPGQTVVQRWRFGMIVSLGGGALRNVVGTTSVPTDWPEQRVKIVAQDVSPGAKVSYQMIDDAVRQMTATFPRLSAGEDARALVTFEVTRILASRPDDTERFRLPDPKKLDRKLAAFLGPSPYIESAHPELRALAKQVGADKPQAWDRVRAIYDWVRQKVRYNSEPLKGALCALRDGTGDCDEMSALFIAICRASDIPARTVRVPDHCYPEFYLWDEKGVGHWFPCQAAGTEAFGEMPDPRPILQKGDSILAPAALGKKKERVRFLPQNLTGMPTGKSEQPKVQFVCELLK